LLYGPTTCEKDSIFRQNAASPKTWARICLTGQEVRGTEGISESRVKGHL